MLSLIKSYGDSLRDGQCDQAPGIFWAGPEKRHHARKPGIIFRSLEFVKTKTDCADAMKA